MAEELTPTMEEGMCPGSGGRVEEAVGLAMYSTEKMVKPTDRECGVEGAARPALTPMMEEGIRRCSGGRVEEAVARWALRTEKKMTPMYAAARRSHTGGCGGEEIG